MLYSVVFYYILLFLMQNYSILLYSIHPCHIPFYSIQQFLGLFHSILFFSIIIFPVIFCSVLICRILFYSVWLSSVLYLLFSVQKRQNRLYYFVWGKKWWSCYNALSGHWGLLLSLWLLLSDSLKVGTEKHCRFNQWNTNLIDQIQQSVSQLVWSSQAC